MARPIVGHLLAASTAFGLAPAGLAKLASVPMMVEHFAQWGYPWFFVYLIGALEVTASVLAVVPRTRFWGAVLGATLMVGAIGTHLTHHEADQVVAPLVILVLASATAWVSRPR